MWTKVSKVYVVKATGWNQMKLDVHARADCSFLQRDLRYTLKDEQWPTVRKKISVFDPSWLKGGAASSACAGVQRIGAQNEEFVLWSTGKSETIRGYKLVWVVAAEDEKLN